MKHSSLRSPRITLAAISSLLLSAIFFFGCGSKSTEPGTPLRGVLNGTIFDIETGGPLAGATVSLFDGKNSAVTDGNGKFEIDSIPIGADKITVAMAKYITLTDTVEIITDRLTTYTTFLTPSFKGWITGWQPVQSGTSQHLTNASFADAATIYVCGFAGTLLRSIDTGKTWTAITLPTSENLYCVNFSSPQTGIVMGNKGTILRTFNGSATWNSIDGNGYDFRNASYSNASQGMAVGGDGNGGPALYVTNDGGATWTDRSGRFLSSAIASTGLYGVFRMGQVAFVGNSKGKVYRTGTEGTSWTVARDGSKWCRSISFIDPSIGTIVGEGSDIENTNDGGFSWTTQTAGPGGTYAGISRTDPRHTTIVGDHGAIIHTRTSGASWLDQSLSIGSALYNSAFADSVHGVIVGENGTILLPLTK